VVLGVGVDLVEIPRIERTLTSPNAPRFLQRVFSSEEREACESSSSRVQSYAARFAAKEAVAKALGTGFSRGVSASQISVSGGDRSRPEIVLSGRASVFAKAMGVGTIHISLTHTKQYACAVAVLDSESSKLAGLRRRGRHSG
jgi:holo-[acyl-carrier protein] synthase